MFSIGVRLIGLSILVAIVYGRPQEPSTTPAAILNQVDVNNPDGSYNSSFETSNGIKVENNGYMKTIVVPKSVDSDGKTLEEEHEAVVLVQTGSYSYSDPDGNIITLRYVADENGFQPAGDHLPVAPEALAFDRQQQH